ncbi:MAG: glycosyltransferase [Pseudonocardiales bacterium]
MPSVALIAVGAGENSAVGSRIDSFRRGLAQRGWRVTIVDLARRSDSTAIEWLLDHAPTPLRSALEGVGIEGDVQPTLGWHVRHALRHVRADVVVVSVPPFSLLGAMLALDRKVPLVVDYRDPWSARHNPPPVARATRAIERRVVRRASAVVYAGGATLGDLLIRHFRLPSHRVVSVPNGVDPHDLVGLHPIRPRPERNGQALQLVMNGYWYGRNGPGILLDALERVGPSVAQLTVIGGVAAPIVTALEGATGGRIAQLDAMPKRELYQRLQQADAAVVNVDHTSAVESRIPAKVYDYLATGVPVIVVCPSDAALLQEPGAHRFHHVHRHELGRLVALLRLASHDRTTLRPGRIGAGPTRELGLAALHRTLLSALGRTTR